MTDNNEQFEKDDLHLTRTQASRAVAGILLCTLFAFIGGYFWGKRSATISFVEGIEQDAFTDQISYSLYALNQDEDENTTLCSTAPFEEEPVVVEAEQETNDKKPRYCAHLVGYQTRKAAENFSKKLAKKGVKTFVRERGGSSAAGKKAPKWFQVVTETFEDKAELLNLVDSVKTKEKINCVSIVTIA